MHNKNHCRPFPGLFISVLILLSGFMHPLYARSLLNPLKPGKNEFSVMTYNLFRYAYEDRDGDEEKDDMKPQKECDAVLAVIADEKPDILAVQEMGDPKAFKHFTDGLAEKGMVYEHTEYLRRGGRHEINTAVLSRFPIVSRQSHTTDVYSIGPAKIPVGRGFIDIDIQVAPHYTFRLMVAHLKAKVFHPLGQTEMRRNEARLLNKHVRRSMKKNEGIHVLVVGDMNDNYKSAAMREVFGKTTKYLYDTRPRDNLGTVWTHFTERDDTYSRIDYILINKAMAPLLVRKKTHAVSNRLCEDASDHRPLVGVFRIPQE